MAKRRGRKKGRKHNPIGPRGRRAITSVKGAFAGLDFKGALRNVPPYQIGMWAATWAAKRFASEEFAANQTDPESWNYASYLKGGLGAVAAAIGANMLRPGWGQKVLEGGLNMMLFKLGENELVPKSEWATAQFGEDEEPYYAGGEDIVFDERGAPYMLGENGDFIPVDERHRLPEEFEGSLEPVGPLGATLEPVGPLGQSDPWADAYLGQASSDPFRRSFL